MTQLETTNSCSCHFKSFRIFFYSDKFSIQFVNAAIPVVPEPIIGSNTVWF